jgi:hypothetical protein
MISPDTIISTRRFFWRFAAESFGTIGCVLPRPRAVTESPTMPWAIR